MSASFAQRVFFSNSDTSLALQTHLFDAIRDLDHPERGRFGSHFLLFPLLAVNKHLRKEVAKYLYKHVIQGPSPALIDSREMERSKLTIQRWTTNTEVVDEENDPRFLWTNSARRRHTNPSVDLFPVSFDPSSISLEVTYKINKDEPCVLSIETMENPETGRAYPDLPAGFVLASSAAFTHASEKLQEVNKDVKLFLTIPRDQPAQLPGPEFALDDNVLAVTMMDRELGYDTSDADRWGLRSAVPIPTECGLKVAYASLLIPKLAWPCTKDPNGISEKDVLFTGGFKISYTAKLHTLRDFEAEYSFTELSKPRTDAEQKLDHDDIREESKASIKRLEERWEARVETRTREYRIQKARNAKTLWCGIRKNLIALRVKRVRAPLMRLLKPSVTTHRQPKADEHAGY